MFHIIFTMICVLCSLCAFDKRALFQKGHDIIVYVRHVFQTNPKTGEPEPSDLCKTCKHIDKCTGYMDTKYGRDKSMPDFPCDTQDLDVLRKLRMEIYPDCELYEDFDYSKCNGCDRCKQWQKFPDCDTCPAKNYCDGVVDCQVKLTHFNV